MNIAILGFGIVGSGVYEIINNSKTKYTTNLSVKKILVRSKDKIINDIMTDDYDEIVNNKDIDVIVEAMGGKNPAYEYILKALQNHKHVVTSNKEVVSEYLELFTETAKNNNVAFMYEASVGGGIP